MNAATVFSGADDQSPRCASASTGSNDAHRSHAGQIEPISSPVAAILFIGVTRNPAPARAVAQDVATAQQLRRPGRREVDVERIAGVAVDLLVIGAGAVGAATALHAARSGASVAVVDRGDVAGATSSASSKLLHGGLRYLAMGDLGLVRAAHAERRANALRVAPHLVRPLAFVVPVRDAAPVPLWKVRAGVFAYAALSRFSDGRSGRIPIDEAVRLVPDLATDDLRGTVLYHDHQTNDARLTLSALQGAAAAGALVATYTEVVRLLLADGRVCGAELVDRLDGRELAVRARAVVNATGPWIDRLRALESPRAGTSVLLSKGVHLALAGGGDWTAAVTTPLPAGRVAFAIPWEGMLLLGTTDELFDGDPAAVRVTAGDVSQILEEAAGSLVGETVAPSLIRSRLAGLRVLPLEGRGGASNARRETVISRGPGGMVTVAGGKLTTWRLIGAQAAAAALPQVRPLRPGHGAAPLPGAVPLSDALGAVAAAAPGLELEVRENLARHYGMAALDVLGLADGDPELLGRIHADGPDVLAQVVQAREREWAASVDDVVHRRTTLGARGLDNAAVRERIGALLGE
jgi:glycerol-3-phosphate dehydrogenase